MDSRKVIKRIKKNGWLHIRTNGDHFHHPEITVNIDTGVIEGKFSKRALRLLLEWYEKHNDELMKNCELCRNKKVPKSIDPLE